MPPAESTDDPALLRQRPSQLPSAATTNGTASPSRPSPARTTPYLPTPTERLLLSIYPSLLLFGSLFALLNPLIRSAPFDTTSHAHDPSFAPSYFARKDNILNILFVKRGWLWISLAFFGFLFTHPALENGRRKVQAVTRWALVTAWWTVVTQWFFGPPVMDRTFRWTGGQCRRVEAEVKMEEMAGVETKMVDAFTAAACRASGGRWSGGHDISGHVFLLVLGSVFLVQEVGWAVGRWYGKVQEERSVVMGDGAVKRATVEELAEQHTGAGMRSEKDILGVGGKVAAGVVVLSWWMMLMTAIFFHTWFEKLTGLLVASTGLYAVYILPRGVQPLRNVLGLPGI